MDIFRQADFKTQTHVTFYIFFETFISTLEIIIMCQHSSLHHNHTDICNMVSLSIILKRNSNNSLCEKKHNQHNIVNFKTFSGDFLCVQIV